MPVCIAVSNIILQHNYYDMSDKLKHLTSLFLDNVHFQQAAQISKALVDEQVDFDAMVRQQYASEYDYTTV